MCVASAHADSPFGAIRAWHNPKRLLRVCIHAKGGTLSIMVRASISPDVMVDVGFGRL